MYKYTVPLLATWYEVITCNDSDSFYIIIDMITTTSHEAVVLKTYLVSTTARSELHLRYQHKSPPSSILPLSMINGGPLYSGQTPLDGGVEVTHVKVNSPESSNTWSEYITIILEEWSVRTDSAGIMRTTFTTGSQPLNRVLMEPDDLPMKWDKGRYSAPESYNEYYSNNQQVSQSVSYVGKFLSDSPYLSEPFFRPSPLSEYSCTKMIASIVNKQGGHLFYYPTVWTTGQDYPYYSVREPTPAHTVYHRDLGYYRLVAQRSACKSMVAVPRTDKAEPGAVESG